MGTSDFLHRYGALLASTLATTGLGAFGASVLAGDNKQGFVVMLVASGLAGFALAMPSFLAREIRRSLKEVSEQARKEMTPDLEAMKRELEEACQVLADLRALELPAHLSHATVLFKQFLPLHEAIQSFNNGNLVSHLVELIVRNYSHIPHQTPSDFYRLLYTSLDKALYTWDGIHHGDLTKLIRPDGNGNGLASGIEPSDEMEAREYFARLAARGVDADGGRRKALRMRRIIIVPEDEYHVIMDPAFVRHMLHGGNVISYFITKNNLANYLGLAIEHQLDDCARYDDRVILHYDRHDQGKREHGVVTIAFERQIEHIPRQKTRVSLQIVERAFRLLDDSLKESRGIFTRLDSAYLSSLERVSLVTPRRLGDLACELFGVARSAVEEAAAEGDKRPIGERLVARNLISREQLDRALQVQAGATSSAPHS